jgi:hypothetical protein
LLVAVLVAFALTLWVDSTQVAVLVPEAWLPAPFFAQKELHLQLQLEQVEQLVVVTTRQATHLYFQQLLQ